MNDVRVLLADRSPTVRSVLKRTLGGLEMMTVAGETGDGRELIELVRKTSPDCLVTDLDLVGLGGRELIEAVAGARRIPIFALIPATRRADTRLAFAAHKLGVVWVHPKPDLPDGWEDLGSVLKQSIFEVCGKTGGRGVGTVASPEETVVGRRLRYVGIGASTGGPGALSELLIGLGSGASFGIAVVQHIAAGFEPALVEWLRAESGLDVAIAQHGEALSPGKVRFAPAANHLLIGRNGDIFLDDRSPAVNGHTPSIETLFSSLLEHPPETVAAIQLSGMGSDGARAMANLRSAHVLTMAQDEASCAAFGMPRTAIELGGVAFSATPKRIGRLLARAAGMRT